MYKDHRTNLPLVLSVECGPGGKVRVSRLFRVVFVIVVACWPGSGVFPVRSFRGFRVQKNGNKLAVVLFAASGPGYGRMTRDTERTRSAVDCVLVASIPQPPSAERGRKMALFLSICLLVGRGGRRPACRGGGRVGNPWFRRTRTEGATLFVRTESPFPKGHNCISSVV